MIDDVATRPRNSTDPSSLDFRMDPAQGGFSTTDEGEILMTAETELIPVKYKQVDRRALSKFENLDQDDIVKAAKKEAKQERITDQIKYQTADERLDELKRKNLDFDTLMNEMVKECRHIYEDEVGIRPIKRGEGVETLDQIIDNLYNDDFKVKNLPPKSKSTATEATTSLSNNQPIQKNAVSSNENGGNVGEKRGLVTEKYHIKVNESPENLFDSFGGNDSTHVEKKPGPNPFMMDSFGDEIGTDGGLNSKRDPQFATDSPPHHSTRNSSVLSPEKTHMIDSKGGLASENPSANFGTTELSGQLSFGQGKPNVSKSPLKDVTHSKPVPPLKTTPVADLPDDKDKDLEASEEQADDDEAIEEGQDGAEEGNEEAGDEEGGEEGQEEAGNEEGEEETLPAQPRKVDYKVGNHSKNSSLGDGNNTDRAADHKGALSNSNVLTPRGEESRKADSKKKVTFSEEIDKQEF